MKNFGEYAHYYDLLYRDKDYEKEANFVHGLIHKYSPNARTILELGCGTGRHAELLASKGYDVLGIDRSREMLEAANKRLIRLEKTAAARLSFDQGDVRTYRTDKSFDAVISLFHVMSYQTTNKDLQDVFETAKVHLNRGGLFIFDCWYGPAVLTDRPAVRVKRLEDDAICQGTPTFTKLGDTNFYDFERSRLSHFYLFLPLLLIL